MARRRALDGGDTDDAMMGDGDLQSLMASEGKMPLPADPFTPFKEATSDEGLDMFAGAQPRTIDTDPDTSGPAGSRDRPRDLRPTSQTPPTFGPQMLPQGVTVDDGMFSGVSDPGNAMNVPGQSMTPSPSSGNMSFASPESGTSRGPQRRSQQPSVLYAQPNSPTLAGRAGGLLEGGIGATGLSDRTGPLTPTDMFQRLLQMFRGG